LIGRAIRRRHIPGCVIAEVRRVAAAKQKSYRCSIEPVCSLRKPEAEWKNGVYDLFNHPTIQVDCPKNKTYQGVVSRHQAPNAIFYQLKMAVSVVTCLTANRFYRDQEKIFPAEA
jgi:hypothetical protein